MKTASTKEKSPSFRRLDDQDYAAVIDAAVMVDKGREGWSCCAINEARYGQNYSFGKLTHRYARFYGNPDADSWHVFQGGVTGSPSTDEHRVLLLLLFAEACS